jgi:2-isopropylmalate synthase
MKEKVMIYDSTLRDGAQGPGISFSVEDKLKIVKILDDLGVSYIEAGNPGSNPKDLEFFHRLKDLSLKTSKIIAFGSTRKVGIKVLEDSNLKSLLSVGTDAVAIFGKSWDFQVTDILRTTLDENRRMIYDTVRYLKDQGKEVVYDAEHFFDGYKENPDYAIKTLESAVEGGADSLCLCDTNGGCFPDEIFEITKRVREQFGVVIGIHCHNDNGTAVANSIMAVKAGARQVQGTFNGYGERCGNANLTTIIPGLQVKLGFDCIPDENMSRLTEAFKYLDEVANVMHDDKTPYVGRHAFAHKAGMHADAVQKNAMAYEHISPEIVGNVRTFLMSEVAGRTAILKIINRVDPTITRDSAETLQILEKLKELEYEGYQYEGAESSFEIIVRKILGKYKTFFQLEDFKVIVNEPANLHMNSSAIIKINVGERSEITASEGDGPVNALDKALRKALEKFYPQVSQVKLTDYKVRVLDSESATAAKVRVLIESTDGEDTWNTIGVSTDIIDASWKALVDSIQYKLMKEFLMF